MKIYIFSSREFTRDVSVAKRAAMDGQVFITDRGRPAFALLKIDDYYRIADQSKLSLLDVMDGIPSCSEDIDFDRSGLISRSVALCMRSQRRSLRAVLNGVRSAFLYSFLSFTGNTSSMRRFFCLIAAFLAVIKTP